jgi:hypothetical protein
MNHREQVAYHEAAHVVISHLYGGGPTDNGIDINAESSVAGSFGNASVGLLEPDDSISTEDQQLDLIKNIAIICAGAASDAKILGITIDDAIEDQSSDFNAAWAAINSSRLVTSIEEGESVFDLGLKRAESLLADKGRWALVEKIALACIENGGNLSKMAIGKLLP